MGHQRPWFASIGLPLLDYSVWGKPTAPYAEAREGNTGACVPREGGAPSWGGIRGFRRVGGLPLPLLVRTRSLALFLDPGLTT